MARTVPLTQYDFSGGELPPMRFGRTDDPVYHRSVAETMNMLPMRDGPISVRPGTRRVALGSNQALREEGRLVSMSPTLTAGYVLEIWPGGISTRRVRSGTLVRDTITVGGFPDSGEFLVDGFSLNGDYEFSRTDGFADYYTRTVAAGVFELFTAPGAQFGHIITFSDFGSFPRQFTQVGGFAGPIPVETGEWELTWPTIPGTPTVSGITQVYEVAETTVLEVTQNYLSGDIPDLRFAYSGDTIYVTHQNYAPAIIFRESASQWRYEVIKFKNGPYEPAGPEQESATLRVEDFEFETEILSRGFDFSALSAGDYVSYKVGSDYILSTFVRSIVGDSSRAVVRPVRSVATTIAPSVRIEYQAVGAEFLYLGDAVSTATISASAAVLSTALEGSWLRFRDIEATGLGSTVKWVRLDAYLGNDVAQTGFFAHLETGVPTNPAEVDIFGTSLLVTSFVELDHVDQVSSEGLNETWLSSSEATFSDFVAGMQYQVTVGPKAVNCLLVSHADNTPERVRVAVDTSLPYGTDSTLVGDGVATSWRRGAFYPGSYPSVVGLFSQRLVLGGTQAYPDQLWFSVIDDYFDFSPVTPGNEILATSGFSVSLSGATKTRLRWLHTGNQLIAGMEGAIWLLRADGGVFTATSFFARKQSDVGSVIPPVQLGPTLLVVHSSGRRIYEAQYDDTTLALNLDDGHAVPSHLFNRSGQEIREILVQEAPEPMVWILRKDGMLLCLQPAWSRERVTGYAISRHSIGSEGSATLSNLITHEDDDIATHVGDTLQALSYSGTTSFPRVQSITALFDEVLQREVLYVLTARSAFRYIESLSFDYEPSSPSDRVGMLYLDSAREQREPSAVSTWHTFGDYEGQRVNVFADDQLVHEDLLFSSPLVLATPAARVVVGLSYDRYFVTLPPSLTGAYGNTGTQGRVVRVNGALVTVKSSLGVAFAPTEGPGSDSLLYDDFSRNPDIENGTLLFTGAARLSFHQNRNRSGQIKFSQPKPYPLNILSITYQLEIE